MWISVFYNFNRGSSLLWLKTESEAFVFLLGKGLSANLPITTGGVVLLGAGCGRAFGGKTTSTIQKPEERWQASRDTARNSGPRGIPNTMLPLGRVAVERSGILGFHSDPGICDPRADQSSSRGHKDKWNVQPLEQLAALLIITNLV